MSASPTRPRWMHALMATAAITVALIFVAWAKMDTVQITYEIADLEQEEDGLARTQRRLRAELSELRSPNHLEELAPELGLVEPDADQLLVVGESEVADAAPAELAPAELGRAEGGAP